MSTRVDLPMADHRRERFRAQAIPPVGSGVPGEVLFLSGGLFSIRNVSHSNMIPALRAAGYRVRVLGRAAPTGEAAGEDAGQRSGLAGPSAPGVADAPEIEELRPPPVRGSTRLLTGLDVLQHASFFRRHGLANGRVTKWWYRRNDPLRRRAQHAILESLSVVGSRDPFYRWQLAAIDRLKRAAWDITPSIEHLRARRPAVVVATSCISWLEEPMLRAARALGIPTLGCVQSFDHLTDRSSTADCDHYAVWNGRMKDQLLRYHSVRHPSQVHVTGTPQFDFHVQDAFRWSRAETLGRLGLATGERYVLYAANTYAQTPTEPELVGELAARCNDVPELRAHRIVVRLHPNDDFTRWERLPTVDARIVVSHPSGRQEHFAGPEDQARLVSTLLHADVCHNMWSSMSLDAAAVGTPVVCVAFAGRRGTPEDRFTRMVYDTDFFRPIVESGGVRMARDIDELVGETVAYVSDRARDEPSRRRLAEQECGPLDGHSAERVATLIASIAAAAAGARG